MVERTGHSDIELALVVGSQLFGEVLGEAVASLGDNGVRLLPSQAGWGVDMAAAHQKDLGIPQVLQQLERQFQVEDHRRGRGEQARNGGAREVDHTIPMATQVHHRGRVL